MRHAGHQHALGFLAGGGNVKRVVAARPVDLAFTATDEALGTSIDHRLCRIFGCLGNGGDGGAGIWDVYLPLVMV